MTGSMDILNATNKTVWLQIGTLLDGLSDEPIKNAHLVYNADTILFVGKEDALPPKDILSDGQVKPDLVLENHCLLPGLIEAHAHIFLEGGELDFATRKQYLAQDFSELMALAKERLAKIVHIGIMGIRDAGDKMGVGLALSKIYQDGDRPLMPYLESPGAAINRTGRYGRFMSDPLEDHPSIEACVKSRIEKGADRIKLIPTGIINFKKGKVTKGPQMNLDEITEFVRVSKEMGKQTFAHASGDEGIEWVIEGGVDSVEHGFFMRDDQLSRMRDRQTAWIPTFAPVQKQVDLAERMGWDEQVVSNLQNILDNHAASLVKASDMGVPVVAGSDAGSYAVAHGLGFLYELELMEKAGMAPIKIINSATGVGSERLQFKEKIGQIKAGYKSRFILTKHSPLTQISNLKKHKVVVFDGQAYTSPEDGDYTGL